MTKNRGQFSTILDINQDEHARIKRFVGAVGYDSLRGFIKEAIYEKMQSDLERMDNTDRKAVMRLIGLTD